MNTPDTTVTAAAHDELLKRSLLRAEQQRIHVAELADHQALRAKDVLTEMLISIDRITEYQAKFQPPIVTALE